MSRMCTMGQGFDRHLYALYKLAQEAGGELPEIFSDEGFKTLMTDTLCTSMLEAPFAEVMMANPAFLMALPTKNDPMLSYLTTAFQDHVRIRE